ncbi:MAG: class I SAM-dependent methyltransferase [Candidatus Eremiobacteraeota bacterium]|nr:class I SAM-dependent methyltransferase [Candidatus Eremiobacteraeota bacterium]
MSDAQGLQSVPPLCPLGSGEREATRLPVTRLDAYEGRGTVFLNCLMQELIAPRCSGSVLNIGAGGATELFRQNEMFQGAEYHTQEIPEAKVSATYIGDACNMPEVPDNYYDWVMSFSVLEHVLDPWAMCREKIRVTKPGGLILTKAPFSCVFHVGEGFGDLWRFTPMGLQKMFSGCTVVETALFGDDPRMPANTWTVVRKGLTQEQPRHYWFDMPNEWTWDLFSPGVPREREFPLYALDSDPMEFGFELNQTKIDLLVQTGINVPQSTLGRELSAKHRSLVGHLGFREMHSYFRRV